ncbi:cytochrome P450 [Xylariomycetidae sp. FL0641]|nr:cytochrome P450 [Xylariomycetidae sp. FL0641]
MAVVNFVLVVAKYAALIFIPYLALLFAYRLFLHPLRNYPGPLAARLTNFYAGFHAIRMRLHLATYEDQKIYGPVMRAGPNKLIFNSAQALQDIYNNDRVTKSDVYLLTMSANKPSVFSSLGKEAHRTRRKVVAQAVTDKAMREFEPTMQKEVDIFISELRKTVSSNEISYADMSDRCKRLGMDIVGHLAFGYSLQLQTDITNRFMLRGLAVGTYQNNCFMQFPLLKKIGLHNLFLLLGYSQRMKYMRTLEHMIRSRLSEGAHDKNDLYSFVYDHLNIPADGITTSELWSEALFFFPAAGDTTTTTITALFFYLSRYPQVYRRVANEIRNTFTAEAEIRGGPKLSSCRFLRACIDETLRISPPVNGTLWRNLYPGEQHRGPFVVDGHVIPKGTQVGVCNYSLHHNERYFEEPFVFRPERWLVDDEAAAKRMHAAFNPFSLGPRGCAGKPMAYLEVSLVISKTFWHFDFEVAPGQAGTVGGGVEGRKDGRGNPAEFQLYDTFGSRHAGPNLVFRVR